MGTAVAVAITVSQVADCRICGVKIERHLGHADMA